MKAGQLHIPNAPVLLSAGGAIICRGRGCRVTLTRVKLHSCALVALHGAQVYMHETAATVAGAGIGVFACGAGTNVCADQLTVSGGNLGVSIQGAARFNGVHINIVQTRLAGLHACGTGSYMYVRKARVHDLDGPNPGSGAGLGDGVHVTKGAVCVYEDATVEAADVGIEISGRGRATLKNCRVRGCAGSSVLVEDAGVEMFDCTMEGSGGSGLVLRHGADAEAHGCSFTRCTLNAAYVLQGSEAVLRWCTLELSGLWSGLEVDGRGSAVECHSCLFLRNNSCGVFVHSRAVAELSACESEGNGMVGYRVHGRDSRLTLDGCCARDVVAYQRHMRGWMQCVQCSPGGQMMSELHPEDRGSSSAGSVGDGEAWDDGPMHGVDELPSPEAAFMKPRKPKRGLFRALVRAIDRKRN